MPLFPPVMKATFFSVAIFLVLPCPSRFMWPYVFLRCGRDELDSVEFLGLAGCGKSRKGYRQDAKSAKACCNPLPRMALRTRSEILVVL